MCTVKMRLIFLIIVLTKFSLFANVGEIVLTCKMNYGISGENDETDIEFKNLSIIDQDQVFYLNLEEKWLSVESKKDIDEGKIKYSKNDFGLSDSTIFSMSLANLRLVMGSIFLEVRPGTLYKITGIGQAFATALKC